MVDKVMPLDLVRVSSFWHLHVEPQADVALWRVQDRNRYWMAVITDGDDGKPKLSLLATAPGRSQLYSWMLNYQCRPSDKLIAIGMAWYGDKSEATASPEDMDKPCEETAAIVAAVIDDIAYAYLLTVKYAADCSGETPNTIPIRGTIR